jgi:hypothetical protein
MVPLGYLSIVCPWSGGNASTGQSVSQSVSPLTAFPGLSPRANMALTIRPQAAHFDQGTAYCETVTKMHAITM